MDAIHKTKLAVVPVLAALVIALVSVSLVTAQSRDDIPVGESQNGGAIIETAKDNGDRTWALETRRDGVIVATRTADTDENDHLNREHDRREWRANLSALLDDIEARPSVNPELARIEQVILLMAGR